jgi:hypothetical protein
MTSKIKTDVKFLAVDQFTTTNIVAPTEVFLKDRSFVCWGTENDYPDYIEDLYQNVSTLHSIIDGTTDYVCGDKVKINVEYLKDEINSKGDTIEDLIQWIAKDLVKYNGFALNIIKNRLGTPAEIYYLDFRRIRSNKEGTKFYYSTDWSKSFGRVKYTEYDSFCSEEGKDKLSTVFYFKNDINRVYPTPMYAPAVVAAEIEKKMNEYHLNNISNSFSSNYIINFNNGRPSDEVQEEIEMEVYDKFCGVENSGRPMLSFNSGKDAETTVTKIDADSFIDKYNSLAERSQQELFTSFRATPNLFGITTKTTGFSEQEYNEAYKLYNRTVIKPMQKKIEKSFDKIFGMKDSITIVPFAMDELEEKTE